jgi:DNA-directed RNA polymerase sigma subunit (sigma70/sigma32)
MKTLTDDQLYDADAQDPDRENYKDDYKQRDVVNAAEERNRLLDAYFRDLDKLPRLLKPGETKSALITLRSLRKGTKRYEQLRNQLTEAWLRFASWAASEKRPYRLDYLDALQIASLTLVKVIDSVDPEKLADEGAAYVPGLVKGAQGGNFATYLLKAITNALLQASNKQTYSTALPYDIGYRLRKAEEALLKALQREPTREELSKASGVGEDTIASYRLAELPAIEISAPLRNEDDSASEESVSDYIEQKLYASPEDQLLRLDDRARVQKVFEAAKPPLTDLETTVIRMRFGLTDGIEHSVHQIAVALNLSITRAQSVNDRAIKKLKQGVKEVVAKPVTAIEVENLAKSAEWKLKNGARSLKEKAADA